MATRRVPYALPKRRRKLIARAWEQRQKRKLARKLWMLKIAEKLGIKLKEHDDETQSV